jgi:hypothetical protein
MRQLSIICLVFLALLGLGTAVGAQMREVTSRVEIDDRGRVLLSGLPAVFDDDDVQRHLFSGLTTSFLFRVRPPRPYPQGASRIDIRLELWDEVFLVTQMDGEGHLTQSQHSSLEALRSWWSGLAVVASGPVAASQHATGAARVSLDVIPFSQAELMDTQRWLAESMGGARAGGRTGEGAGVSRAVGALIATSMQRRAVRAWQWNVSIESAGTP